MKLTTGTIIHWHSAGGHLIGTIKSIHLSPSAAKTIAPWLIIDRISNLDTNERNNGTVMLCGTDQYLSMMKVEVAPC
jgi:hypothetical protein